MATVRHTRRTSSWATSLERSRTRFRVALTVVVVFLVVQLVWWLVFQKGYIESVMLQTTAAWARDARTVERVLQAAPQDLRALQAEYPHLDVRSRPVRVNPEALEAFREKQIRHLRMFSYEGPFFLLVILGGLGVVAWSFRLDGELRRRQSNFLMAATHEYRTPISTLRLLIETAQYRELPRDRQLEHLRRMEGELRRLQDASERVLATARLEGGHGVGELRPQDLRRVVEDFVASQRAGLESRGATLTLELPQKPVPTSLDASAFGIVLGNLLDNAVKYSPDETKPVIVRVREEAGRAVLEVEDRGVGIARGEAAQVFDQFYRVGNELTRDARGLGLGLFLVRGISELMGGRATCEPLARGTRFTVRLPLGARAAETEPAFEASARPA